MAAVTWWKSREVVVLTGGGLLLAGWTAWRYPPLSLALVLASLALAAASHWSCRTLYGDVAARTFLLLGIVVGWLAEAAGVHFGWLFGSYRYTDVLGPQLAEVPLVIPLMWFGLTHVGWVLATLLLWREPGCRWPGPGPALLAALLAALLVTAFDLGADPYFVYVLKAWIMTEKDGDWFGETVRGFEGWLVVSFVIVLAFQWLARPVSPPAAPAATRGAALLPVAIYAGFIAFQVAFTQPVALRVVAAFAMGIPALVAGVAWTHWARADAPEAVA